MAGLTTHCPVDWLFPPCGMDVARRVVRKWASRARVRLEVERSGSQVWVGLSTKTQDVGYIILDKLGGYRLKPRCEASVGRLVELFPAPPTVYRVVDVQVEPEFLGQGYGIQLYERALREAAPTIVVSGGCTGMGTAPSAFRVWQSLAKRYPTAGSTPGDFAIAVH